MAWEGIYSMSTQPKLFHSSRYIKSPGHLLGAVNLVEPIQKQETDVNRVVMWLVCLRQYPHLCDLDIYNQAVPFIILPETDDVSVLPSLVPWLPWTEHSTLVRIFHCWDFLMPPRCVLLGQKDSEWRLCESWETLPRQCWSHCAYGRRGTAASGTSGVELVDD